MRPVCRVWLEAVEALSLVGLWEQSVLEVLMLPKVVGLWRDVQWQMVQEVEIEEAVADL